MLKLQHSVSRALLALSPLARRQRLSILIYHRVIRERDPMRPEVPTVDEFAWQMQLLQQHFTVLPLREAVQRLKQNRLPPRAVCVTFDDGYADTATVALPVLQRFGIPVTVFVAAAFLNGGRMWNDTVVESLRRHKGGELDLSALGLPVYPINSVASRTSAAYDIQQRSKRLQTAQRKEVTDCIASRSDSLPDDLMLTTGQLTMLHEQGVEIGGHTYSHPILNRLTPAQAQEEIQQGKIALEEIIGQPLNLFAYPNGRPGMDYNDSHVELVKRAGFNAAVATSWGVAGPRSDHFQLPRFTPWDKTASRFLLRMVLNSRHLAEPGTEATETPETSQ